MFTVGMDVDTFISVSNNWVTRLNNIKLYAGILNEPGSTYAFCAFLYVQKKASVVGKITGEGQSAGNFVGSGFEAQKLNLCKFSNCLHTQKPVYLTTIRPPHVMPKTDIHLGQYLAGLIEGDGYFENKRLTIVLHIKDIRLAHWLTHQIGAGKVQYIKDKQAVRVVVRKKIGLTKVIQCTNGHWVGDAKLAQLRVHGFENWCGIILKPALNFVPQNSFWTAGFLDADGSIGIFMGKNSRFKGASAITRRC